MTSSSVLSSLWDHIPTLHTWPHHHHQAVLFECFRQEPLSGHVGRHKLYWQLQFLVSLTKQTELGCSGTRLNLSCQPENQQEIPTNCSPAALGNVRNGCDVSIFQEHQPTKTCALWYLVAFTSGRWNCSLWGRKWHFPFRGDKLHTMESASTSRQRAELLSWVIN